MPGRPDYSSYLVSEGQYLSYQVQANNAVVPETETATLILYAPAGTTGRLVSLLILAGPDKNATGGSIQVTVDAGGAPILYMEGASTGVVTYQYGTFFNATTTSPENGSEHYPIGSCVVDSGYGLQVNVTNYGTGGSGIQVYGIGVHAGFEVTPT